MILIIYEFQLGLKKPNDSVSSILNTDEKQTLSLLKKSKQIKKEQTLKLNAECSVLLRENELTSTLGDQAEDNCTDFYDDDLSVKEEIEVKINIIYFAQLIKLILL